MIQAPWLLVVLAIGPGLLVFAFYAALEDQQGKIDAVASTLAVAGMVMALIGFALDRSWLIASIPCLSGALAASAVRAASNWPAGAHVPFLFLAVGGFAMYAVGGFDSASYVAKRWAVVAEVIVESALPFPAGTHRAQVPILPDNAARQAPQPTGNQGSSSRRPADLGIVLPELRPALISSASRSSEGVTLQEAEPVQVVSSGANPAEGPLAGFTAAGQALTLQSQAAGLPAATELARSLAESANAAGSHAAAASVLSQPVGSSLDTLPAPIGQARASGDGAVLVPAPPVGSVQANASLNDAGSALLGNVAAAANLPDNVNAIVTIQSTQLARATQEAAFSIVVELAKGASRETDGRKEEVLLAGLVLSAQTLAMSPEAGSALSQATQPAQQTGQAILDSVQPQTSMSQSAQSGGELAKTLMQAAVAKTTTEDTLRRAGEVVTAAFQAAKEAFISTGQLYK